MCICVLAVLDLHRNFENIIVLKDFPNNVSCKNCGSLMGKINRRTTEVTLFSFRIMRVTPYEFIQLCSTGEDVPGHSHNYGVWSKIMDVSDTVRVNAVHSYYCRSRRLLGPCQYSPGHRALFEENALGAIDEFSVCSDVNCDCNVKSVNSGSELVANTASVSMTDNNVNFGASTSKIRSADDGMRVVAGVSTSKDGNVDQSSKDNVIRIPVDFSLRLDNILKRSLNSGGSLNVSVSG